MEYLALEMVFKAVGLGVPFRGCVWLKKVVKVQVKSLSRVRLFATPWTIAHQAPQSMEFSRQEGWSELPFPSPGDLPNPGIEPASPALQADALPSEPPGKVRGLKDLHVILRKISISCELGSQVGSRRGG